MEVTSLSPDRDYKSGGNTANLLLIRQPLDFLDEGKAVGNTQSSVCVQHRQKLTRPGELF